MGAKVKHRPSVVDIWERVGLLAVVLSAWVLFAIFAQGFATEFNVFALGRGAAVFIVIGLAQMVVLATGGMNIAVGAIGGIVAMFTGGLMEAFGVPYPVAILAGLALGAVTGWLNGFLIVKTRINAFIVTLGMASVYTGIMLIVTKAEAYRDLPADFVAIGRAQVLGMSPLVPAMLLTVALLFVMYRNTKIGRQMLAVGANVRTARLSGVPADRVIQLTHMLSGVLAGLAGIMLVSRLGAAIPSIGGTWVLASFAAPAIGGTLLSGGVVSVTGTFLGGVLLASIENGLTLINLPSFWIELFTGLVLLLAVMLDRARSVVAQRSRSANVP